MPLPYPIGTPGKPWNEAEKEEWFNAQTVKRLAKDEIYAKIDAMRESHKEVFEIIQYGALSLDPQRYPLYVFKSLSWNDEKKKTIMVTGGVHGYETSGVQGALRFLETKASDYTEKFNVLVFPAISPWGYETINRWNSKTYDVNRNFREGNPCEESHLVAKFLKDADFDLANIIMHMDLHETTDTDNSEFIPALSSKDNLDKELISIPDGFYIVGDSSRPIPEFHKAVLDSVAKITHICDDEEGLIAGEPIQQPGVFCVPYASVEVCAGVTQAPFVATTEVYPDSKKEYVDDENCTLAQVQAVIGAIDYALSTLK